MRKRFGIRERRYQYFPDSDHALEHTERLDRLARLLCFDHIVPSRTNGRFLPFFPLSSSISLSLSETTRIDLHLALDYSCTQSRLSQLDSRSSFALPPSLNFLIFEVASLLSNRLYFHPDSLGSSTALQGPSRRVSPHHYDSVKGD